ncbi:MAG TPA: DUF2726 domain-containing protein [Nitrospiraceae bacterium]|nr:DUF2726 domain-containing protein [Nitrospiraceae bacterium]
MEAVYLLGGGAAALVVAVAGWLLSSRRSNSRRPVVALDPDTAVTLKPVLTEAQARFYNLLRLAVEDRYLVFAQVPLWCMVSVSTPESGAHLPLLSQLALKRAAFVLVHPGTRLTEKVVDWNDESGTESTEQRKDALLEAVLKSAGVQLITIRASDAYTVADIVVLLELGEAE